MTKVGALICGRHLFDHTQAWGGNHPLGVPVFVVTPSVPDGWPRADAPFTFVTDGITSAVAQAKSTAGEKTVVVASSTIVHQCLNAGLLDEIQVNLVPVLLGEGHPLLRPPHRYPGAAGGSSGYRGDRRHPPELPRQIPLNQPKTRY